MLCYLIENEQYVSVKIAIAANKNVNYMGKTKDKKDTYINIANEYVSHII